MTRIRMSKFATRGPLGALAHTRPQAKRCEHDAPAHAGVLGAAAVQAAAGQPGPGFPAFAWGRAAATESGGRTEPKPEPDPERKRRGRCGARPCLGEWADGLGSAVAVFLVRVPRAPWGRWNPREGLHRDHEEVPPQERAGRLTAGSSSAAQPPLPPAPPGSREPEITEMLQGSTCNSARRHCGSHGARARVSSGSHVPFSQGDVHRWMSCPMKRER
ncbi:uncharacterized protein LOC143672734 [Tamandua tetradactyla]|uniref:uncharacterized protein LOC143672734 n=1 Tax=Tamandua tetradactyla TaxID=48850 RepID=UPI004053D0FF